MHKEIVTLRQTLKTATRHGWLDRLPDFSEPYRPSSKVSYRAWFSPEEYEKLCEATRKRALEPKKSDFRWKAEQLHDYVLFAGHTGLRPDEARRLEFRDVKIVDDEGLGETILEIEVRGKRGFGYCKSMPGAVSPFERLRTRRRVKGMSAPAEVSDNSDARGREWHTPEPTDPIFPKWHSELFKTVLEEENLGYDRDILRGAHQELARRRRHQCRPLERRLVGRRRVSTVETSTVSGAETPSPDEDRATFHAIFGRILWSIWPEAILNEWSAILPSGVLPGCP